MTKNELREVRDGLEHVLASADAGGLPMLDADDLRVLERALATVGRAIMRARDA